MKVLMAFAVAAAAVGLSACDQSSTAEVAKSATTPSVQEQACLAAVSKQTSNGDVAVISSEFSEANTQVMIGVGPQRAPWKCLVSNDGVVAEVTSTVDEGAL